MTTLQLAILCATALGLAGVAGAVVLLSNGSLADAPLISAGATAVVHTLNGHSIRGVVTASDERRVIISDALFVAGKTETSLPGGLRIPSSNIAYVQELSPPPAEGT